MWRVVKERVTVPRGEEWNSGVCFKAKHTPGTNKTASVGEGRWVGWLVGGRRGAD